jgi:hypothetical protein
VIDLFDMKSHKRVSLSSLELLLKSISVLLLLSLFVMLQAKAEKGNYNMVRTGTSQCNGNDHCSENIQVVDLVKSSGQEYRATSGSTIPPSANWVDAHEPCPTKELSDFGTNLESVANQVCWTNCFTGPAQLP